MKDALEKFDVNKNGYLDEDTELDAFADFVIESHGSAPDKAAVHKIKRKLINSKNRRASGLIDLGACETWYEEILKEDLNSASGPPSSNPPASHPPASNPPRPSPNTPAHVPTVF